MDEDSMTTQQRTDDMITEEGSSTESDAERLIKEAAQTLGAKQTNQCYCGTERILGKMEMQCVGCYRWFHEKCLSISIPRCVPFMMNYAFICKKCNANSCELFQKKTAGFSQVSITALANLLFKSREDGTNKNMFSRDKEIIPWIDSNWELLMTGPRRVTQTWHTTILKTLQKESSLFINQDDVYFGLVDPDLYGIMPSYDASSKLQLLRTQENQQTRRGPKRKLPDGQTVPGGKCKLKSDLVMPRLPAHGYPNEHPFNKDGYHYFLAEPDPHAPFKQEFDESVDWAGKPIPGWLYRKLEPEKVLLAMHDRAPQLKISDDRLSVTGDKGYSMVRATHGVTEGSWYFEAIIQDLPDNSAARIGYSMPLGNLQAPLGYDRFGYSWRSRKGTKFHQSLGKHFSAGFGKGDVVGFLIELPRSSDKVKLPTTYKERPLVKFKQYLYYEDADKATQAVKNLVELKGSRVSFFKNGKLEGVAFENLYEGTYYPAISLYKNATIKANFGPRFRFPPRGYKYRAISEAVQQNMVEQTMADMIYLVENEQQFKVEALNF
ncbi:set1/Ash2 histone methyltransferase complex subunit ASH2 [Galendromus occidentalis]|uniref:Set1/Ash2 histone methyltransferase complex subunit ASH2 n=1 Tax=Galendromus occidentalis TaxID=34638 RepID=A0AAJ7L5Q0_9ACAR|nr:set1/Ash2 histone methyltransferase complex subunit ASH2 [Galendromus occidentalis]